MNHLHVGGDYAHTGMEQVVFDELESLDIKQLTNRSGRGSHCGSGVTVRFRVPNIAQEKVNTY